MLTDGSPWVTGTEGEKYIGNRTQANEDLQKREDLGSNWDESNLAKFSKSLGFTTEGFEGEILKLLLRLKTRRDQGKKKGIPGMLASLERWSATTFSTLFLSLIWRLNS